MVLVAEPDILVVRVDLFPLRYRIIAPDAPPVLVLAFVPAKDLVDVDLLDRLDIGYPGDAIRLRHVVRRDSCEAVFTGDDVRVVSRRRRLTELVLEVHHRFVRFMANRLRNRLPLRLSNFVHREGVPPVERSASLPGSGTCDDVPVGSDEYLRFSRSAGKQVLDRKDSNSPTGVSDDDRAISRHAVAVGHVVADLVRRLLRELDDLPAGRRHRRAHLLVVEAEAVPAQHAVQRVHDDLHRGLLAVELLVLRRAGVVGVPKRLLFLPLGEEFVDHLPNHAVRLLLEVRPVGCAEHLAVVALGVDFRLRRGVDSHHTHRVQRLQVEHRDVLLDAGDGVEDGPALVVLRLLFPLRGERELAVDLVEDVDVDGVAGRRRVFELTADERPHLVPEGDDVLFPVDFDAQLHVAEVVFEQAFGVFLPEVTDVARVALLARVEFEFAHRVEAVGFEFGELGALVGVQQVEDDATLDVRAAPAAAPHLAEPRDAVVVEVQVGPLVDFLQAVEEVRRVEVLEVPPGEDVGVGLLDVREEGVEHLGLLVERPDLHVSVLPEEVVVRQRVGALAESLVGHGVPDDVLVAVGVVAGQTDNRLFAVLGEAVPVVDLDVEGVHPEVRVDLRGRDFLVRNLNRPVVEAALGDADAAFDVLVDEQAVRKEDVRLVVVELVANLPDVAGGAAENLRQLLAADALVAVLGAGDNVLVEVAVVEAVGGGVEVRPKPEYADVFGLVVGRPAEDVNHRVLVAARALDGVIDLRDGQFDRPVRVGKPHLVRVDDVGDVLAGVAGDDGGLLVRPRVARAVGVVPPEVGQTRLRHGNRFGGAAKNPGVSANRTRNHGKTFIHV